MEQARDLFLDLRQPEEVEEFLKMPLKGGKVKLQVTDAFRDALLLVIQNMKDSK